MNFERKIYKNDLYINDIKAGNCIYHINPFDYLKTFLNTNDNKQDILDLFNYLHTEFSLVINYNVLICTNTNNNVKQALIEFVQQHNYKFDVHFAHYNDLVKFYDIRDYIGIIEFNINTLNWGCIYNQLIIIDYLERWLVADMINKIPNKAILIDFVSYLFQNYIIPKEYKNLYEFYYNNLITDISASITMNYFGHKTTSRVEMLIRLRNRDFFNYCFNKENFYYYFRSLFTERELLTHLFWIYDYPLEIDNENLQLYPRYKWMISDEYLNSISANLSNLKYLWKKTQFLRFSIEDINRLKVKFSKYLLLNRKEANFINNLSIYNPEKEPRLLKLTNE